MEWIFSLKENIHSFVERLSTGIAHCPYRYSLSGDLISTQRRWGLPQSVFVSKTLRMIDMTPETHRRKLKDHLNGFQTRSGRFCDYTIIRRGILRNVVSSLKQREQPLGAVQRYINAESRQCYAALRSLELAPVHPPRFTLKLLANPREYLKNLNWNKPWAAGSHLSHAAFFISEAERSGLITQIEAKEKKENLFAFADSLQQTDGSWHRTAASVDLSEKINGAMKILTAYQAAEIGWFPRAEKLVDLCLSSINSRHACDHLNVVYVLSRCLSQTNHRREEASAFLEQKLESYREHYWPEYGGFSFFPRKANAVYCGAKISRGLAEPDIHGTVLFLWGICLISDALKVRENYGLRLPVT